MKSVKSPLQDSLEIDVSTLLSMPTCFFRISVQHRPCA